jgi:hypothetical protein
MSLVPRADFPSVLVDKVSGLEFTERNRDVAPPLVHFYCEKFHKVVCVCEARRVGLLQTPTGPVLKFVGSLSQTRAYFEACLKSFTSEERSSIGSFDDCLPKMLQAWQVLKDSPQLQNERGRVEITLADELSS